MADEQQETLREVIYGPLNEVHEFDGAVITGCVVITEWSDTEGRKWITKNATDINDEEPPTWTVEGWLHHALYVDDDETENE